MNKKYDTHLVKSLNPITTKNAGVQFHQHSKRTIIHFD
jgi:hypothetical protein